TFTTAKRLASSCEKRLRYWSISRALAMEDSRRMMVWRVWRWGCMQAIRSGGTGRAVEDVVDGGGIGVKLVQRHPFVSGMGLGDIARAERQRGHAGMGEQRGFGPEVHRVADRQTQRIG